MGPPQHVMDFDSGEDSDGLLAAEATLLWGGNPRGGDSTRARVAHVDEHPRRIAASLHTATGGGGGSGGACGAGGGAGAGGSAGGGVSDAGGAGTTMQLHLEQPYTHAVGARRSTDRTSGGTRRPR